MAREFLREEAADADGYRKVFVKQVENRNKPNEVTREIPYFTFGATKDSPAMFARKVAALLAASEKGDALATATLADWYDKWVYGVDLDARQDNKTQGPAGTVVTISKDRACEMVSGKVFTRDTPPVETGVVIDLADRIEAVNGIISKARMAGGARPRQVDEILAGWIAAGVAREDGGRVVAVASKGNATKK